MLVKIKDLYEMQTVKTLMDANTTQHSIRVCSVAETKAVFREITIFLEIITWTPQFIEWAILTSLEVKV